MRAAVARKARIADYDGLAVRSATKVTAALLAKARRSIKVVGRAGIGVDNIDVPRRTQRGIVVRHAATATRSPRPTHAIAMMMALAARSPPPTARPRAGKWEKSRLSRGRAHPASTLVIVGCAISARFVADARRACE